MGFGIRLRCNTYGGKDVPRIAYFDAVSEFPIDDIPTRERVSCLPFKFSAADNWIHSRTNYAIAEKTRNSCQMNQSFVFIIFNGVEFRSSQFPWTALEPSLSRPREVRVGYGSLDAENKSSIMGTAPRIGASSMETIGDTTAPAIRSSSGNRRSNDDVPLVPATEWFSAG